MTQDQHSQHLFGIKVLPALWSTLLVFFISEYSFTQSIDSLQLAGNVDTDSTFVTKDIAGGDSDSMYFDNAVYEPQDFNSGIISDPFLLLQGQVAGVQIYNVGGDPNVASYVRMRGLNSIIGSSQPTIVIDGVVDASLDNVDVFDIAEIRVLRKGSEASKYGIRSASGVVEITTKNAEGNKKLNINANVQSGLSTSFSPMQSFSAQEYLDVGNGFDLGSETDWFEQVSRRAPSFVGNIAASGNASTFRYRVSANYRDVNGVLLNSGFKTYNTRARVSGTLLNDRVTLDFSSSYTNRRQSHSFREAFYQATVYNPTAPIYGDDAIFAFISEQYGGYFQQLGLFNAYNPLSLVDQNQNIAQTNIFNTNTRVGYQLSSDFSLNMRIATQNGSNDHRQYFSTKSLYRGNAISPLKKGAGEFENRDNNFILYDSYLEYYFRFDDVQFDITAGFLYQLDQQDQLSFMIAGFDNDNIDIDDESSIMQQAINALNYTQKRSVIPDKITTSTYLRAVAKIKEKLWLNANFSLDDSSLLGTDTGLGIFGGVDMSYELLNNESKSLRPRVGIGFTGGLPEQRGLAFARSEDVINADGTVISYQTNADNPELSWEKNQEYNIGLDLIMGSFSGALDIYQRNITDLISKDFFDVEVFGTDEIYQNNTNLSTRGLELNLEYTNVVSKDLAYVARLNLSTSTTSLVTSTDQARLLGFFSGPGLASTNLIQYREGERLGDILGYVFTGVDAIGEPIYEDFNGDGVVQLFGDPFGEASDYQVLGNTLPKLEFGWSNMVKYKNWECSFLLRGALGHSKINSTRMYHEVISDSRSPYNFVTTSVPTGDTKFIRFDSRYVEKADFLKLDNIQLTRVFNFKGNGSVRRLGCSIVGQNILTFTGYSGVDPEPILADFLYPSEQSSLISGMDRRVQYYPSRTISIRFALDI